MFLSKILQDRQNKAAAEWKNSSSIETTQSFPKHTVPVISVKVKLSSWPCKRGPGIYHQTSVSISVRNRKNNNHWQQKYHICINSRMELVALWPEGNMSNKYFWDAQRSLWKKPSEEEQVIQVQMPYKLD